MRVCLLTGAAGSFGQAFCRRHADRYQFAAVYHAAPLALASQECTIFDPLDPDRPLPDNDRPVFAVQADLSTQAGCEWAVQAALERFGCIDLVIHGAAQSVWAPVIGADTLLPSAEGQFAVNVLAPLRLSSALARWDWGHHHPDENVRLNRNMVSLSSTAGVRLYPNSGQSVYAASKAALNHLSCHLADEFRAIGVRVNVVAPDSFPGTVALDDVLDAVALLDQSRSSGRVLMLDATGRHWLRLPRQT